MTRNYNDWIIKVEKSEIDSNEFIAEFYIPKTDGRKQFQQFYRYVAEKKTKPSMVYESIIFI